MMKKIVLFAVMLFLQPVILLSQAKYDFVEEAGLDATVYRGPEAVKYPFRYEGTPYAYSEKFLSGSLVYNGVEYKGLLLNLNAHRDELHLKVPSAGIVLELDKNLVGSFSFGNRMFVGLVGAGAVDGLNEGFYQVLYSGKDKLLKKNVKSFHERLQNSGNSKGVFRFFDPADRYYAIKDGVPVQVSKVKHFSKVYREKKKAIKGFIRKNRDRFIDMEDRDMALLEVMAFIDNN